ncbi:MAG: RNA methyltransferase [Alphaproteobacteria bacterium]|nr:RNA methyltransferase [Alphaproteobacteria bacterium]
MDARSPSPVPIEPPVFILDRPQLAENIGAAARVMLNFGLDRLRLVRPRDGWPQPRAWAAASGAEAPLDAVEVFDRVEDAVADLHFVLAATARPREVVLPVMTPRQAAPQLRERGASQRTGILFGGERAGLESADIALCQAILTIPVAERHRSLNLAQAVALCAYEWRLTEEDAPPARFRPAEAPADGAALLGLYEHLEGELETAGFFHPPEKKATMVRNLRAALGRGGLNEQEVRTLRGVVTALARGRGKVLAKLAAKAEAGPRAAENGET